MRDWESSFKRWGQTPAETEEARIQNAIRRIREAVRRSSKLENLTTHVFVQGSYRNRVNVRQNSDVDVGVLLCNMAFNDKYPPGTTRYDFGNIDSTYSYRQFKNDLEEALVDFFGRPNVKHGDRSAQNVPGYLLECMAWNIGNDHFSGSPWHNVIKTVLLCMKIHTRTDSECESWREVDSIKTLFHQSQPWTRAAAYEFVVQARRYIGAEE